VDFVTFDADLALFGDTDLALEAFAFFGENFLNVVFSELAGDGVFGPLVLLAELSALLDRGGDLFFRVIARVVAISKTQSYKTDDRRWKSRINGLRKELQ